MATYRRVYDSHYLQADCKEPGVDPEPYAQQSSMGYFYLFTVHSIHCTFKFDSVYCIHPPFSRIMLNSCFPNFTYQSTTVAQAPILPITFAAAFQNINNSSLVQVYAFFQIHGNPPRILELSRLKTSKNIVQLKCHTFNSLVL